MSKGQPEGASDDTGDHAGDDTSRDVGKGAGHAPPGKTAPREAALADHLLTAQRLAKVDAIRAAGGEPYPFRFAPTDTAAALHAAHGALDAAASTGVHATVAGRLMARRDIGKLLFGVLQDQTGQIQLFADSKVLGDDFDRLVDLDLGDWVGASGEIITTKRGELSVKVEEFTLLAKALRPLPEKWHGLQDVETRYRRRYLDLLVNPQARETALTRSKIVSTLRREFENRGFIEVETPVLQLQAGGALARPFMTHHNALGLDVYLRIALELHLKRLIVGGLDRVFEIGRTFRNEGVSPKHNPEFTMLEAYVAYADYFDIMDLVEEVVTEVVMQVAGSPSLTYRDKPLDFSGPWPRIDMLDSIAAACGVEFTMDMPKEDARKRADELDIDVDGTWGVGKIAMEVFERHVEPDLWEPTFVTGHPVEVSPLAREHRDGGGITERFEFFAGGWEIANAFSELNDPIEQRRRFEAQAVARAEGDDEAHLVDEDYLLALEYGMPPTGGLGVGVDRLTMILTDQETIREVILFPHMRPEA